MPHLPLFGFSNIINIENRCIFYFIFQINPIIKDRVLSYTLNLEKNENNHKEDFS